MKKSLTNSNCVKRITTITETIKPAITLYKSFKICLYIFFGDSNLNLWYSATSLPAKRPTNTQVVDIGILFNFTKYNNKDA